MKFPHHLAEWVILGLLWWGCVLEGSTLPFVWSRTGSEIRCRMESGCYLYVDATHIEALRADGSSITLKPPAAERYFDKTLSEDVAIYRAAPDQPLIWQAEETLPAVVTVEFQGCRSAAEHAGGICYPPQKITLTVDSSEVADNSVNADGELLPAALRKALGAFPQTSVLAGLPEKTALLRFLTSSGFVKQADSPEQTPAIPKSFSGILLLVFLGGLGLNLTPCVLPMIPVNLAIIGAGRGTGRKQGLRRGLLYALGITIAYGALGIPAALTGSRFGELNSTSWFNLLIGIIFLILAAGMFGVFQLDFSRFDRRSGRFGKSLSGTSWRGDVMVLGMGAVSALLAGACVAPVVISVVLLAVKFYGEGQWWGLGLPFALGLAMALPWPLAGMGLAVLPKPGRWMNWVKFAMGFLIAIAGIYYMVQGIRLLPGRYDVEREIQQLTLAAEEAAKNGKTLLIDFRASWCKNCAALDKMMEDSEIQAVLKGMQVVHFQAEQLTDPQVRALLDRWKLPGLPALVLLRTDGEKKN